MKNAKLYPFERNRYYPGKMLVSADFQAEQTYFNNKRRFINNLMYGSGIVCGCGVFNLDDLSIMVESGVAIDGMGREIIIDSSVVKKLSAIEGFDTLVTEQAALCLRYAEEEVHTVYTMNQASLEEGKEYEYNRISEGYQLFLMDTQDDPEEFMMETEFLTQLSLLSTEDYEVRILLPSLVSKGHNIKLVLEIEKISEESRSLDYQARLQTPVFLSAEGGHEVEISCQGVKLSCGEKIQKEYWMYVERCENDSTSVVLKSGSVVSRIDGEDIFAPAGVSVDILLSKESPKSIVNRAIGRMSLEIKTMGGIKDYIRLADLFLVRTGTTYVIEDIKELNSKNYIIAPAQESLRNDYLEFFEKDPEILKNRLFLQDEGEGQQEGKQKERKPEFASGILEVPLGENAKKGDIRYSGEIMHGLGAGNVYVEIGYEYITSDEARGTGIKNTIYGNPELFKGETAIGVDAQTAVKVLNDRGSFIVAAKLLKNVDSLVLTYRWVAIRFPSGNELEIENNLKEMSIYTDTPTVVLGTKDSHYFKVKFKNMEHCGIVYELTEPGSGEITTDGVYTAPSKEGVYEIRIYCAEQPIICTYAYAIVKRQEELMPDQA